MSFPVKPHWHYFAEFIYVINGKAAVTCDGIQYDVSEGEFIILYPSAVHSIMSTDGKPILFAGLKFDPAKFQNSSSYAPSVTAVFRYARSKDMKIHFSSSESEELNCREIFFDCVKETELYLYGRDIILRAQIPVSISTAALQAQQMFSGSKISQSISTAALTRTFASRISPTNVT